VGSPVTFSGFNQIDFNLILNAVMRQERLPLDALEARRKTLQSADGLYATLTAKLGTLRSAAADLGDSSTGVGYSATSSDEQSIRASGTGAASPGRYEIVVSDLARAQVMASATTAPDTDTTTVATGGTITIDGVDVSLSGSVTLQELAAAINETADIPVTASIIQTAPGSFRLVLTASESGESGAFTVSNALTGATISFTDTDGDDVSGDSAADNTVQASNASFLINGITVTSSTNEVTDAVPGVTLTLVKEDPSATIVVDVARDEAKLTERIEKFSSSYNDLVKFAVEKSAAGTNSVGGDSLMRALRRDLRAALTAEYGTGTFTRLAEVGIGFNRTGQMTLDTDVLSEALSTDPEAVASLLADSSTGAFGALDEILGEYVQSGGFVSDARTRVSQELSRLASRIADMEERLEIRRQTLLREYIAADQLMSRLNSQISSLASFGSRLQSTDF
jgi:flagellar hook-associated protein 2